MPMAAQGAKSPCLGARIYRSVSMSRVYEARRRVRTTTRPGLPVPVRAAAPARGSGKRNGCSYHSRPRRARACYCRP